jgi:hypothetical protein
MDLQNDRGKTRRPNPLAQLAQSGDPWNDVLYLVTSGRTRGRARLRGAKPFLRGGIKLLAERSLIPQAADHLEQFIHTPNRVQPLIKEALRLLNVVEAGQPEQPIRRAAVADGDCQERKLIELERVAENPDPAATYLANCCCRFVRKYGMDGVAGRMNDFGPQTQEFPITSDLHE